MSPKIPGGIAPVLMVFALFWIAVLTWGLTLIGVPI